MGAGALQDLVEALARALDAPVLVEDPAQQPLVHSAHDEVGDPMRQASILRRRTDPEVVAHFAGWDLHHQDAPLVIPGDPDIGLRPRLCIPLRVGDGRRLVGFAWVLLADGVDDVALPLSADVAAMVQDLARACADQRRARAAEEALVDALTAPGEGWGAAVADTDARLLGGWPRQVLVCGGPGWADVAVRQAFWAVSWGGQEVLRRAGPDEGVVILRPTTSVGEPVQALGVVAGVAVAAAVEALPASRVAARRALRVAVAGASPDGGVVADWDRLGVLRLLSSVPAEALEDGVDPRVRALVRDDPVAAETLEQWLDNAAAINATAQALHIHRNTLYQRLDRARAHGLDPMDGQDRLALHAGFKALRLAALRR